MAERDLIDRTDDVAWLRRTIDLAEDRAAKRATSAAFVRVRTVRLRRVLDRLEAAEAATNA